MRAIKTALGFLLIVSAIAQEKLITDVEGWSKAKWGMTEAQVLAAFGNDARRGPATETSPDPLTIYVTNIDLGLPARFTARFRFDPKSGALFAVHLQPEHFSTNDYGWFASLTSSLASKYGAPSGSTDEGDRYRESKTALWSYPKTEISVVLIGLKKSEFPAARNPWLMISYRQVRKDVLDKL